MIDINAGITCFSYKYGIYQMKTKYEHSFMTTITLIFCF